MSSHAEATAFASKPEFAPKPDHRCTGPIWTKILSSWSIPGLVRPMSRRADGPGPMAGVTGPQPASACMRFERPGFTLIEVMVATALVGVVLITALTAAAADLRASRRAVASVEAAALADAVLARMELLSMDGAATLLDGRRAARFDPPLDRYRWQVETFPVPDERGLVEVTLRIAWPDGSLEVSTRKAVNRTRGLGSAGQ